MSNKPIKNDDVVVMFSASMGTEYGIDKVTGLDKDTMLKLLHEMMKLSNNEIEIEPEEYLEKAGATVEPIISSSGMNDDKGMFYDFDFSYDAGIVIEAEDLPIKKQSKNLINRLSFSDEILSAEEKKAILESSEKIDDIDRIEKLIDDIAMEGYGIKNGGISKYTKGLILVAEKVDKFEIYQIKAGEELRNIRFENIEVLKRVGLKVEYDNYDFVYAGELNNMNLEDIFERFNIDRPEDFKGHSLSVSDVVVLSKNGEDTAYFVDSFGFKNVPEFIASKEKIKDKVSSNNEFSVVESLKENKEKIGEKESVNKTHENKSFNER